jgi:hypothetical protein
MAALPGVATSRYATHNDEYVKVGDEWKFQSRSINLIDLQGRGKE